MRNVAAVSLLIVTMLIEGSEVSGCLFRRRCRRQCCCWSPPVCCQASTESEVDADVDVSELPEPGPVPEIPAFPPITQVQTNAWIESLTSIDDALLSHELPSIPEQREWTDVSGKYHAIARVVSLQADGVTLLKADGQTRYVPLTRLSIADRHYLSAHYAALKNGIHIARMTEGNTTLISLTY